MLFALAMHIKEAGGPALFGYTSTRVLMAFLTSLVTGMLVGRPLIVWLFRKGYRTKERSYMAAFTASKDGTPHMGGVILLVAILAGVLLWCDLLSSRVWVLLATAASFAVIGAVDDASKTIKGGADAGMSEKVKSALEILLAAGFGLYLLLPVLSPLLPEAATQLYLPFIKDPVWSMPAGVFIVWAVIYFYCVTNAVNFADGLDGLCIVPSVFVFAVLGVFAFLIGHAQLRGYLLLPDLPGSSEVAVFCAAVVGSGLAFLWFNCHPAQVFMGDTGSLEVGALMAAVGMLLKQEFLFLVLGGFFVAEAASTLIQKAFGTAGWSGRRIFYQAPLHHSLQHRGLAEPKIVTRVWIVCAVLAALSLLTLKAR